MIPAIVPIEEYREEKRRRDAYFRIIRKAKDQSAATGKTFEEYLKETYGIEPLIDSTGSGYGTQYRIIDDALHTFFLLNLV